MPTNVLVVDDSAVMRSMVIKTLRLSGIDVGRVHEAESGAQALLLLERHPIDLALLDINMPEMRGDELLRRIRTNPLTRAVKVVVVSTESGERKVAALRRNAAGFVHKPFTPEELRETLVHVMGAADEPVLDGSAV